MRSYWSSQPMLRVAFALIGGLTLGILVMDNAPLSAVLLWGMAGITLSCLLCIIVAGRNIRLNQLTGLALTLFIVAAGYIFCWLGIDKNFNNYFAYHLSASPVLKVCIDKPPVEHQKTITTIARVLAVDSAGKLLRVSGKMQLVFLKDSSSLKPEYGDVLLIRAKIDTISGPKNPFEFNFNRYFGYHNIFYSAFLKKGDFKNTGENKGSSALAFVYKIRAHLLAVIQTYVPDGNNLGVASAIMLGYTNYENADIKRAYASAGVIHILSVSGLHVGVMFLMLNFLLGWMDKYGARFKIAKTLTVVFFIRLYACLTGISPPVLRSSLMFSLLQAGLTINRRATTYNILAASAVLLMLFNPLIIMDVGFQLSYLAVAGIVYLQPKIARLLLIKIPSHPKHKKEKNLFNKSYSLLRYDLVWLRQKLLDGCWQLTAVSIAAQIATLPLCLMYFGQFPNLFLLTNLVVLPLSNLVLFSGVAMFVCSYLPGLNIATGWLFNLLIGWLNHFIFAIDKLPFAVTRGIAFGAFEMLLLFLLIIFLSWYSEVGKPKVLLASLVILLSLSSFNAYKTFDSTRHTEIIVYDVPQHKAITFIQGNRAITDFDDSLRNDQTNFNNHIWPHWQNCGINKETTFSNSVLKTYPCCWGALFVFEGKRVLITNNTSRAKTPADDKKIPIDLLIVSGNPPISIGQLTTAFDIHQIVFDSSDKPWKVGKWMNECNSAHINAYNVKEQGAYVRLLSAR